MTLVMKGDDDREVDVDVVTCPVCKNNWWIERFKDIDNPVICCPFCGVKAG